MISEDLQAAFPLIIGWIRRTLVAHDSYARPVAELGFRRLPRYFSRELLQSAKVVIVDRAPMPPLSAFGLQRFAEFERTDPEGITYLDTFFVKHRAANDEGLYFHELIHVVQWRILGVDRFLAAYASGLETCGYRNSPLEKMAYAAQAAFCNSQDPFDAEAVVAQQLRAM